MTQLEQHSIRNEDDAVSGGFEWSWVVERGRERPKSRRFARQIYGSGLGRLSAEFAPIIWY